MCLYGQAAKLEQSAYAFVSMLDSEKWPPDIFTLHSERNGRLEIEIHKYVHGPLSTPNIRRNSANCYFYSVYLFFTVRTLLTRLRQSVNTPQPRFHANEV